jgi:alcohol dehydrogenase
MARRRANGESVQLAPATRDGTDLEVITSIAGEQVALLADIASTGFSGAESGDVRIGDSVVVFAQGPIGLCATAGAKLMGASLIIGVDSDKTRLDMSRRMGADITLNHLEVDVVESVKRLTGGEAVEKARTS